MRIGMFGLAAALLLALPARAEVPLDPGQTATIRLSAQRDLVYPVAPPLAHAPANFGAVLSIDIDEPGRYHVAISRPGWIDLIRDGKALPAAGEPQPIAGSGVAKIVDYDLTPGHYSVALSAMTAGEADVTISE